MAEPLYRQLLADAYRLARLDPLRPKQGNLRRAVSSAYYSMFHFLVDHSCRSLLGSGNERRRYREIMARAFEHDVMVSVCKAFAGTTLPKAIHDRLPATFTIHRDLSNLALAFRQSQEKRHLADYDLTQRFSRDDVLALIREADQVIGKFANVGHLAETRFFLVSLLAWNTLTRRK